MKLTQAELKQIIKEELAKVIQEEEVAVPQEEQEKKVIPVIPRSAQEFGTWENENSFPSSAQFDYARKQIRDLVAKGKVSHYDGWYNINNMCVAAYGYDQSGKYTIKVWRPSYANKALRALKEVEQSLRDAGFVENTSLFVPHSSAD